jgi:hypothetical protein
MQKHFKIYMLCIWLAGFCIASKKLRRFETHAHNYYLILIEKDFD